MIKVEFFEHFHKRFKKLNKKNKKLIYDVKDLVEILKKDPKTGKSLGHGMYKIRVANSSKNIGKRGGFRVITYFIDENEIIYLAEIYEKNDIENIPLEELILLVEKELENLKED